MLNLYILIKTMSKNSFDNRPNQSDENSTADKFNKLYSVKNKKYHWLGIGFLGVLLAYADYLLNHSELLGSIKYILPLPALALLIYICFYASVNKK
jgi:hypothetical protein